ncbi:myosin-binding protein H-like isoform X1 [Anguilla anguilla]|uniref:myosin-binding protein H-like isoform X1 n=1 Tax=Anguilla anguilla TaxID=7936 RepID=UPI0015A9E5CE|nr:myosin-binding protein H-like isoform X1 [Anguilla anguilla]
MPAKPVIKKAPLKKAPAKKAAPAPAPEPAPEPAPAEAPPAEAPPAEAAPAEAAPAEVAPAEAAPAEAAPAAEDAPAADAAPPAESAPPAEAAPADAAAAPPPPTEPAPPEADAAAAPAAEEVAAPAPAEPEKPADVPEAPSAEAASAAPPAVPAPEAPAEAEAAAEPAEKPAAPAAAEGETPAEAPAAAPEVPAPPAAAKGKAPAKAVAPAAEKPAAVAAPEAPAEAAAAPEAPAPPAAGKGKAPAKGKGKAPAAAKTKAPAKGKAPAKAVAPAAEEPAAVAAPEAPAEAADAAAAAAPAAPAAQPPAEDAAAPAAPEAPADAAAAAAPPAEEPKAPTPPPPEPEVPTSEPLNVSVEDVNDTSVTIKWRPPEKIGSGLDGYVVEYCKDQTTDWIVANAEPTPANRLVIKDMATGDLLHIRVVTVNPGGRSAPGALAEPVIVREVVDRPKIHLPRVLKSRLVKKVGEKVNLVIPFSGKPKPVVSWTKDGQALDPKTMNIRNSDKDSILFIRQVDRSHSGMYEMSVKVDSFEDKAAIILQVVELPGPPTSIKLVDTWGFNVALEWTPPQDSGNTEITGYTVQKADKKTGDWFTVLEHFHRLNGTVSDLVMGNTYSFRVFAENKVGRGEEAAVTKETAQILKQGIHYQPVDYKEHDFTEAPKFTTPLSDRAATVGYTTKLLCAVRGYPKPKVEWMKNSMIIGEDPKYRMINSQGICTLEIRKPSCFDGGVYTCRAKNSIGEAAVACKLEVKQVVNPAAEKKE